MPHLPSNNSLLSKKRRITDSPSIDDSNFLAASSAEQVRLLDIDPDSKEGKKEQRKIRNRMSAMMHRERKKQYIEDLENEVREKNNIIANLEHLLAKAREENHQLKVRLQQQLRPAIPTSGHAVSHQEFLGALARPLPTYPAQDNESASMFLNRGRAGTTVTSNEGSGSDSECSVSDLTNMWNGERNSSGLDSDDVDEGLREYLSSETPLTTPTPTSLTPSPTSHADSPTFPALPSQNRHRSIPLYSFVVLLSGISFFTGMFSSPLSFSLDEIVPPFQWSSPTHDLDTLPIASSLTQSTIGGGGRVLLSLPSLHQEVKEPESFSNQLAPIIWSHPNHVTSIYPYPLAPVLDPTAEETHKKRRYLRTEPNATDSDSDIVTVYSAKELAFFYDNTWPSSASSMSKIYLTEGRVLLDPSLVAAASRPTQDHSDTSKAIIPTSWQSTTLHSPRSSSVPFDNIRSSATSSSASSISPNQLLTMIIPATTIQWGGRSWIDGDSPYASHNILDILMRNMNLTSYAMENGLFNEDNNSIDVSTLSIEIACNVLKARIVKDVGVLS